MIRTRPAVPLTGSAAPFAAFTVFALMLFTDCTTIRSVLVREQEAFPPADAPEEARGLPPTAPVDIPSTVRVKETVPAGPVLPALSPQASRNVFRRAVAERGLRIVVSTEARALWLMNRDTVLLAAPVAVGMHQGFTYRGKRYDFRTPIGQRRVQAKAPNPIWTPPDWHYFEKVVERSLTPVQLRRGSVVRLADGSRIEVRGNQVGRVNESGHFMPFTRGNEIIFDNRIFIPPFGTAQRSIPEILGSHKLEMGDGYLIHGTPDRYTIGEAVSHGCVRMYNEDVARLYQRVPIGTAVYIY